MSLTIAVVEVGSASRGGAKATRRFGSHSLLELIVRRVTDCQQLDGVVVLADGGPDDALLAELVPPDVPVYSSDRRDMLGRFLSAAEATGATAVVRVPADNPFVDPVLIDRLVVTAESHPECDYVSYCWRDGRPAVLSSMGVLAEWCRTDALRQAERLATLDADRDQVTRYLYCHPEAFQLRFIPVPDELDRDRMHLIVDDEEAWEHAQTMYDALGPEAWDWRRMTGLWGRPAHEEPAAAGHSKPEGDSGT